MLDDVAMTLLKKVRDSMSRYQASGLEKDRKVLEASIPDAADHLVYLEGQANPEELDQELLSDCWGLVHRAERALCRADTMDQLFEKAKKLARNLLGEMEGKI